MSDRMPMPLRILALVFVVEFCYMGMEMLASRLLSPHFGTSLDVWTSILSVVLAAGAIGNAVGATWSREGLVSMPRVSFLLGVAGAAFALMPVLSMCVGTAMSASGSKLGCIVCAIVLFGVPGLCFGMLNPMLVDMYGNSGAHGVGESAGTAAAAMTCGGIAGTVVCGFMLVPVLGARDLSFTMAAVLYFMAVLCGMRHVVRTHDMKAVGVAVAVAAVAACGVYSSMRVMADSDDGVDFWRDTEYGHVHVFDAQMYGRPARVLNVDGGFESAMYTEEGSEYELVFNYTNAVRDLLGEKRGSIICLGGGAYSVPRALAADGWSVTCVEIDPGVTEIAREWFGLADTEATYDLTCENADGRVWLGDNSGFGADVVFNDTFAGDVPARTLATVEAVQAAKGAMAPDGVFVVNVIGRRMSDEESILADEVATVKAVFDYVYVFGDGDREDGGVDNYIVVGTDDGNWIKSVSVNPFGVSGEDVRPLTDDWCPVEWLCAKNHQ